MDVRRSRRTLLSYIIVIVIKQRDIRHSHTKFSGCLRATIYEIVIILYDYHSSIVSFLLPFLFKFERCSKHVSSVFSVGPQIPRSVTFKQLRCVGINQLRRSVLMLNEVDSSHQRLKSATLVHINNRPSGTTGSSTRVSGRLSSPTRLLNYVGLIPFLYSASQLNRQFVLRINSGSSVCILHVSYCSLYDTLKCFGVCLYSASIVLTLNTIHSGVVEKLPVFCR